jgi:hypothetical protein
MERKIRGMTQPIYLINFDAQTENTTSKNFTVLGTTGSVYTVAINTKPTCTCFDFKRRKTRCKHIYFILTRVMKVPQENEDIPEFTQEQVTQMFTNMQAIANTVYVSEDLKRKYNVMCELNIREKKTVPMKDEEFCPICLDYIKCEEPEPIDYCKYACGNPVHIGCFEMWIKGSKCKKEKATCVLCRSQWNC